MTNEEIRDTFNRIFDLSPSRYVSYHPVRDDIVSWVLAHHPGDFQVRVSKSVMEDIKAECDRDPLMKHDPSYAGRGYFVCGYPVVAMDCEIEPPVQIRPPRNRFIFGASA